MAVDPVLDKVTWWFSAKLGFAINREGEMVKPAKVEEFRRADDGLTIYIVHLEE